MKSPTTRWRDETCPQRINIFSGMEFFLFCTRLSRIFMGTLYTTFSYLISVASWKGGVHRNEQLQKDRGSYAQGPQVTVSFWLSLWRKFVWEWKNPSLKSPPTTSIVRKVVQRFQSLQSDAGGAYWLVFLISLNLVSFPFGKPSCPFIKYLYYSLVNSQ